MSVKLKMVDAFVILQSPISVNVQLAVTTAMVHFIAIAVKDMFYTLTVEPAIKVVNDVPVSLYKININIIFY